MIPFEVEFLLWRYAASSRYDRGLPEWPPAPSRFFSGLVATLHEAGFGSKERDALLWLERQPSPSLWVPPCTPRQTTRRSPQVWVPVNDQSVHLKGSPITPFLPLPRKRAERAFPSLPLSVPRIYFLWDRCDGGEAAHRPALENLLPYFSYLGHSTSLVRVCMPDHPPLPNLVPQPGGKHMLRVPCPGRLARLEEAFAASREGVRREPPLGRFAAYAPPTAPSSPGRKSIHRVEALFRCLRGERLPMETASLLAERVHRALLARIPDPVPEVLSGHRPDGTPTRTPHMAILPLPDAGHPHARGHLLGFALLLPDSADEETRRLLHRGLAGFQELRLGTRGIWSLQPCDGEETAPLRGLRRETLEGPSRSWKTVTPVVLGHYPKKTPGKTLWDLTLRCCDEAGIPKPLALRAETDSFLQGVPSARDFDRGLKQTKGRFLTHMHLTFPESVEGPL